MIKGIVFDCFGVLLADVLKARVDSIEKIDPAMAEKLHDIVRASNRGILTREESANLMGEIIGVSQQEILSAGDEGEVRNEALLDFIKTLRPTYKVALLSNVRSRARLEQRFNPGELDGLFDTVVASGDTGYVKPEAAIYELAVERLGLDPVDCVMIDDLETYCQGAEAVGMRAIRFTSTEQAIEDLQTLLEKENA